MSESLAWDAAEAVAACVGRLPSAGVSGVDDVVGLAKVVEQSARMLADVQQNLVAELAHQKVAEERGATLTQLLRYELCLSPGEAKARIARAEDLSPRRTLTGEPLPARLPATAAAQAEGEVSVEHVRVIQHTMAALPDAVDLATWVRAIAGGDLPDSGGRPTQVLIMVNLADLQAKTGLADLAHPRHRPRRDCAADRLRRRNRPDPHRRQRANPLHRPHPTPRHSSPTRRAHRPRPRLRYTEMRRTARLDPSPPHHPLGQRRQDQPRQPDPALRTHHRAVHNGHLTINANTGKPEVRPPPRRAA